MMRPMAFVAIAIAVASLVGCGSSSSADDISSSAECQEFCQRASQCGSCSSKSCSAHDGDLCPAGTLARLKCEAEKGSWQCISGGGGGWAVVYSCSTEIAAACNPPDAGTDASADANDATSSD